MAEFTLKQLETFVAVVEHNSFTKAAEELFLTQSTVSTHVSSLENALGVILFTRDAKRSIRLTPDGQRIYPAAKQILNDCGELRGLLRGKELSQPLSLGASTIPAQYILPELLAGFLKAHPNCRYRLKRGDSAQMYRFVESGEISIGFVGARQEVERLIYTPLAVDRLVMVTENSPRFQRLHRSGRYGQELLGEPTVAREVGSGTDRTVVAFMQQIGFCTDNLNIVARIDNPETIKSMVTRGAGVSVFSALAVEEEVRTGRMLAFEMCPEGLRRNIYMIRRRDGTLSAIEERFCRYVTRWAEERLKGDVIE